MSVERVLANVFETTAKLPGQVFRSPAQFGFQFADSASLVTREAWIILCDLAERYGDQQIVGQVVDDLRSDEAGIKTLPALDLAITASPDLFLAWLRGKGPNRSEPLYVDGRTIAVAGDSGAWGLWVDQDKELAVLGVPRGSLGTIREALAVPGVGPWYEAAEVDQILGPAYYPKQVPLQLVRELRQQYAAVGGE